ncbi:MAG TPA: hypothetical protein VNJ29_03815 [Candidatus Nitrosotenuis sp.]|nr:hypothetical protein [Candidatus Nitrosotenuis sp.]
MVLKFLTLLLAVSSTPLMAVDSFSVTNLNGENLSSPMISSFEKNGYLIIKDFFASAKINEALSEYKNIVRQFPEQHLGEHFFDTKETSMLQSSDRYFFDSAEEVWPFYNSTFKDNSSVVQLDLKDDENLFHYLKVMNKIGHNLHGKNRFFQNLVLDDQRLKNIAR